MKKILIILLFVFLCSCSNTNNMVSSLNDESDSSRLLSSLQQIEPNGYSFTSISPIGISNNLEQEPYLSRFPYGNQTFQLEFQSNKPVLRLITLPISDAQCFRESGNLIYYSKLIGGDPYSDIPVDGEIRSYNIENKKDVKISNDFLMNIKVNGNLLFGHCEEEGVLRVINIMSSKRNEINFTSLLESMGVNPDEFNRFIDYYIMDHYLICFYQSSETYILKYDLSDETCQIVSSGNYKILTRVGNMIYADNSYGQLQSINIETFETDVLCEFDSDYSGRNIFVYDNQLYFIYESDGDSRIQVVRMKLDGSERQCIYTYPVNGDDEYTTTDFIQNGILFRQSVKSKKEANGVWSYYSQLISIDLKTGCRTEHVFK